MLIIAHRGCSYPGCNQNTIHAFKTVMDQGAPAVEFDVQITGDGVPVIVHNLDLHEVSTGDGRVDQRSLAYLNSIHAGNPEVRRDPIPQLKELITLAATYPREERAVLHLELKGPGSGTVTAAYMRQVIDQNILAPEDFFVSSFIWEELTPIQEHIPEVPVALLSGAVDRLAFVERCPEAAPWISQFFAYPEELFMIPRDTTASALQQRLRESRCPEDVASAIQAICNAAWDGSFYNEALLTTAVERGAASVNVWHFSLREAFVTQAHARGLRVLAYTVNDQEEVDRLKAIGVDGFFTDFYDRFAETVPR